MRLAVAIAGAFGQLLQLSRSHWMTVTVVIVLQPDLGSTVRRALDRVAGTVLGAITAALVAPLVHRPFIFGALALLFAFLFWPTREAERLSAQLAALLSALRDYIAAAREGAAPERAARRRFGLAAAAADASLSRLLGEPGVPEARIEATMAVITYARRLRASLGALYAAGHDPSA